MRLKPTSVASASAGQRYFGIRTAIAAAAANVVVAWPDGNEGEPGTATTASSRWGSSTGGRGRSTACLIAPDAASPVANATRITPAVSGTIRLYRSRPRPAMTNSGPLIHQADARTKSHV